MSTTDDATTEAAAHRRAARIKTIAAKHADDLMAAFDEASSAVFDASFEAGYEAGYEAGRAVDPLSD